MKSGNVWKAVRKMYNIEKGEVETARGLVRRYFRPKMRKYNALKNNIVNKNNANRAIQRSIRHKNIANILVPLAGNTRGGVHPGYVVNALKNTSIKYAIVNKNTGTLKALALVKNSENSPNSRYINVIAVYPSYGHPMMNKILSNAKRNGKRRVNLKDVVQNPTRPNMNLLVKWYKGKGFVPSGKFNKSEQLLPMSRVLFTRSGN